MKTLIDNLECGNLVAVIRGGQMTIIVLKTTISVTYEEQEYVGYLKKLPR